ncbi:hypothetical protein BH10BDE1_BH10BDE1_10580 [soil metagenome]
MTSFSNTIAIGILSLSSLVAGGLAHAESVDLKKQNEEIIARGGVVVTAFAGTAVAGVFAGGFHQIGKERSRETTTSFGKVKAVDMNLSQQLMAGTRPGDVLRFEFMPMTPQALMYATDDMRNVVELWNERVKNLEVNRTSILREIDDVRTDYVNRTPENRLAKLSVAGKAKRIAELSNDLADNDTVLKTAHTKLGESRAQFMTTRAQQEFTSRTGVLKPARIVMELPVQHQMPITAHYTLSRILAQDDGAKARGVTPSVRIVRVDAKSTNFAARNLKNAKRGLIGVAAGVAVILEEITIGAIGEKMANEASTHYSPAVRTEPSGVSQ